MKGFVEYEIPETTAPAEGQPQPSTHLAGATLQEMKQELELIGLQKAAISHDLANAETSVNSLEASLDAAQQLLELQKNVTSVDSRGDVARATRRIESLTPQLAAAKDHVSRL